MAFDIVAKKVTENNDGTYLVKYAIVDTEDPSTVITAISVQGTTKQEITDELVRKYNLWKLKKTRQEQLLSIAESAVTDAKALIANQE
jgi:hypothetical protein